MRPRWTCLRLKRGDTFTKSIIEPLDNSAVHGERRMLVREPRLGIDVPRGTGMVRSFVNS